MTTYIPSLTLPAQIFAQPAASILLPVALGTGIGFSISRITPYNLYNPPRQLIHSGSLQQNLLKRNILP